MRSPRQPSSFRLDERTGRRTGAVDGVAVDRGAGLVLATDPAGGLALGSADGSLGGLRLPRGMAIDGSGRVHLLAGHRVRRFDPPGRRFRDLPGLGGRGPEPRQLDQPRDLAIAGSNLYIADTGNRRVQVFDLPSLSLGHLWTAPDGGDWQPWALATGGGRAYLLDRQGGRVYRHRPGGERLELAVEDPGIAGTADGLAVDRDGRIYVLVGVLAEGGGEATLRVFGPDGAPLDAVTDAGQVRSRFTAPAIRVDHRGRFCLPASLARLCDLRPPAASPRPHEPLAACRDRETEGLLFDRHGRAATVDPEEPAGPPLYLRSGTWRSAPLDSRIHRCQWHRVEMVLPELPPGARVTVSTLTSETILGQDELETASDRWRSFAPFVGPVQPPSASPPPIETDLLVQSRQGRYLWLRLELEGDGFSSPAVGAIEIRFPRLSALDHLPALYSAEEESRWFLERFLAILQAEHERIDETLADIRRLFDPEAVPDEFVDYLASWLALPLEGAWSAEQKRRMLVAAPGFYPRRGTAEGLRRVLQIYLWNLTGVEPEAQGEIPAVTEGFRERRRLLLAAGGTSRLGHSGAATPSSGAPLWSRSFVGRLQLNAFGRAGEVRIVSTGDPERDLFHEFAHRFRVFVPGGWVQTDEDEAMLRRAIDAEKPAHTQYDLCLVEPRLQVGVQSTVGLDSVLGDYSEVRLACHDPGTDRSAPRRRAPGHRLGIDSVLGSPPGPASRLALGRLGTDGDSRVGIETVLT